MVPGQSSDAPASHFDQLSEGRSAFSTASAGTGTSRRFQSQTELLLKIAAVATISVGLGQCFSDVLLSPPSYMSAGLDAGMVHPVPAPRRHQL